MSGQSSQNSGFDKEPSIDELFSRAATGDANAREQLLIVHQDKLRRMVATRIDPRLAQRIDPSDIVQEATIEAAKRLPQYLTDPSMDFYLWLRWITRDRLIDVHREHLETQKRDAGREFSIDAAHPDQSAMALADVLVGDLTSPSNAVERQQNRTAVHKAIEQLDAQDREILLLRHFEQLSTRQTAEVLGISKSGVSKRYILALRKLKTRLVDENPEYDG